MTNTKEKLEKVTNFSAVVEVDHKGQNQEVHAHLLDMVVLVSEQYPQFKEDLLTRLASEE